MLEIILAGVGMKDWRIMTKPNIHIDEDKEMLFSRIAEGFIEEAQAAQNTRGFFTAVLGGGRTPVIINQKIVEHEKRYAVDWSKVYLFFSDERCVPADNVFSNYRMISDTLVKPLSIPGQNIFRIQVERGSTNAASLYEKVIRRFFYEKKVGGFDLALLGIGEDCHTASLFPGNSAIKEEYRLVIPGGVGKEGLQRVTMTYSLINESKNIWFVICGEEKRRAFKHILEAEYDPFRFPAQGVYCRKGEMVYFTDININCF